MMCQQIKSSASSLFLKLISFSILMLLCTTDINAMPSAKWVAVQDESLAIKPNSILDLSSIIVSKSAINERLLINEQGKFYKQSAPQRPLKFLMAGLGFFSFSGGFPSHKQIDAYVAELARRGYNMVRLDFVEETLMLNQTKDFDFNKVQFDRFNYLVAQLKNNGIYIILNGLSSDTGGLGLNSSLRHKDSFKKSLYYDETSKQHWKSLMMALYGKPNPYTGMPILRDPVLAGLILVNENNMPFSFRKDVPAILKLRFSDWLKNKYQSQQALRAAWGRELKSEENIRLRNIDFAPHDGWLSPRMADTQRFFVDLEKQTADWMTAFLRDQGYVGPVTAYDFWLSPAAQVSRQNFLWIDMHNYHAHPNYMSNGVIQISHQSMLETGATFIQFLGVAKHVGKAFTVSEHGHVFWNKYRSENALALPAYAAFQDWDAICQHSIAIELGYQREDGSKKIILPFWVGVDPISRATEVLSALLYLRGDVSQAKKHVLVNYNSNDVYEKSAHLGTVPEDVGKLVLVTGVALNWEKSPKSAQIFDAKTQFSDVNMTSSSVSPNNQERDWLSSTNLGVGLEKFAHQYAKNIAYGVSKSSLVANSRWQSRVSSLRDAKLLDSNNLTDADNAVFHADTKEILLEANKRRLIVITAKTEGIAFDDPAKTKLEKTTLNHLSLLSAETGGMVSVSAMDDMALDKSRRMLIVLATDARNSNMRFTDADETISTSRGIAPVLIKANAVKLKLSNQHSANLKLYSLNLRGERKDVLPIKATNQDATFELDIRKLSHGATTYFELSAD